MDKEIDKSIIRRERRRRIIVWCGVAALLVAGISFAITSISPSVSRNDLTIGTAENGPLDITVNATGRVVPGREEIISSPVSTSVLKVFAQPGDSVKAGTPLLQLDLEQEIANLEKLRNQQRMEQQDLRQLELSNLTNISDLEMQIEVSEMNVNRLRIEADNERRLDSIGSGTGDRVRQAETAYSAGVLELKQLRTRLQNEKLRSSAAETSGRLKLNSSERDIEMMEKTLHQGSIPAPLDGVLTFITSDLGSRIGAGEKVAVVSDLSSFRIQGSVPEGNSSKIAVGARVNVHIDGATLSGTVTNLTPLTQQGKMDFVVNLDNPRDRHLRSGGSAELFVSCGYKSNVLRIPNGSFYRGPGEYILFVLDGNDRLERRTVIAGDCNHDFVEIVDGLREGDRVTVNSMENFKKNKKLNIKN